ncbi:mucoidy inhibitor MuiA family protein [Mucilaginibacter kameinonensis]|uniref:mucoidy inhibitor MuiA family protein n=1 Tax=Mucilaginibacter kameinonensis TaxID=452286 RepID=UPI000EF82812|nr:mucoidy inhibitor MuiA family protein [Mucilaginibacter kameinonensis]
MFQHKFFYGKVHTPASFIYAAPGNTGISEITDGVYLTEGIMFKKLSIAAALFFIAAATRANEGQHVASKVQKVTVFLNGAQVNRTALVNISPGTSTLVFENLSPGIDVQSIQVNAGGDFTILSVNHELDFADNDIRQKNIQAIEAKQKLVRNKIALQNNMLSIYQEEANTLAKNPISNGTNVALDPVKLKQTLDFQTARLNEIKKNQQVVNDQIDLLNDELQGYDKQIAEINRVGAKTTSNVLVTVSSKAALQANFTLSYLVRNASWFPTYDIRAKNVNSPITIVYKANVSQKTGEDWKSAKLTLSTGNPTVNGAKPELTPTYLNFGMYYSGSTASLTKVMGRVVAGDDGQALPGVAIRVKGTSIGAVSDAGGNYSIQLPNVNAVLTYSFIGFETTERQANAPLINVSLKSSSQQLNEVVVAGYGTEYKRDLTGAVAGVQVKNIVNTVPIEVKKEENQTNIEFNIANPYTVPSDGKQYAVEISQYNIDATYQYYVAPKLSTDVFLTAQLTNWNKYSFLSGEANLFFEGTYIGKSLINTDATTDTLNLSLGTDKNIVVTRSMEKGLAMRQSSGSNLKETRNWLIDVKNRKSQSVNLLVEDQVPVSQNKDIEVEAQETSGAKPDATTGKVSWNFVLNSLDEKKVKLKYQVKYPKNQSVIVQ